MAVKKNKIYCGDGFPNLPDFEAMESGGGGASAGLIAYEQKTLKADQAYTAGDNFIYAGTIYVATANIAKDADIVLEGAGANAEALDPVQEQINDIEASMQVAWDYSTAEVETGKKWIDGKSIYCKVVDCDALPATATTKTVAHGITGLDTLVSAFACARNTTSGIRLVLNDVVPTGLANSVRFYIDDTNINIQTATTGLDSYDDTYAVLEYTKTA